MIGPLPTLHRLAVTAGIVLLSACFGMWLGLSPEVPVLTPVATLTTVVVGALLAWLVVRTPHDGGAASR